MQRLNRQISLTSHICQCNRRLAGDLKSGTIIDNDSGTTDRTKMLSFAEVDASSNSGTAIDHGSGAAGGTKSSSPVDVVDAGGNLNSGTVFDGFGTEYGCPLLVIWRLEVLTTVDNREQSQALFHDQPPIFC